MWHYFHERTMYPIYAVLFLLPWLYVHVHVHTTNKFCLTCRYNKYLHRQTEFSLFSLMYKYSIFQLIRQLCSHLNILYLQYPSCSASLNAHSQIIHWSSLASSLRLPWKHSSHREYRPVRPCGIRWRSHGTEATQLAQGLLHLAA